jgi:hypothetical protein
LKIDLHSIYFKDISWTLSYSPEEKGFVSYHDWYPDYVVQTDNHFLTVKDNTVWEHNIRTDLFCNYYDKDYPYEIEPIFKSNETEIINSIEYKGEHYKYKPNQIDKFHVLNENFDTLIVSNSEQISPMLYLKLQNSLIDRVLYQDGVRKGEGYEILFTKEEQRYRINQFWDSVKDRGEFTNAEYYLWHNDESGYKKVINPVVIDLNKPIIQRKKFRHDWVKFFFAKSVVGAVKHITKLFKIKKTLSMR